MVREGRIFISVSTDPDFASNYNVQALEVGAQVTSGSSGTTATVRAGHGFAALDKFIVGTDTTKYRTVNSVTSTTLTLNSSISLSAGDILINLAQDTGTSTPNFDGNGLTIYTDMAYSTQATNNTVQTDSGGRYRYWHTGIAIWELVRTGSTPISYFLDATTPGDEDRVNYGVRYAQLFATSGSGTVADPWVTSGSNPVQAAYDNLPTAGVGGGGIVRMMPGVYDLGSASAAVTITNTGNYFSGVTIEGYSMGNQGDYNNAVRNDDAVILLYSGTGAAIKIGHFATAGTYWCEDVVLRNFKLRQNGTAGTGIGILARSYRYGKMEDISITDFSTGIGMASVSDFNEMRNLRIKGCTTSGVEVGRTTDEVGGALLTPNGQCNSNRFLGCDFRNTARNNGATAYGLYIHSNSVGNVIRHSEFHDFDTATYGGIFISGDSADTTGTVVDSNYFEGNYFACKHQNPSASGTDMAGVTFTNNYVTQIEQYGFWANSGSTGKTYGCVVTGNVFQNPTVVSPYNVARGIQLGTYVTDSIIGPNVYKVQSPLGYALGAGINVNHGELGTLTDDVIQLGSMRVTNITGGAATFAVLGASTLTGAVGCGALTSTGNVTSGGHLRGVAVSEALTGSTNITTAGRFLINITNTSGTNTFTISAPSSVDGQILILRCVALTAGTMTLADSGNVVLSAAWVPDAGDMLTLVASGVVFYEIARAAN